MLHTSGLVSLKERLLYFLNKLFVKQVKSFHLLLDLDPFIFLCSLHNIKYIKFTSLQDVSMKVMQLSHSLLADLKKSAYRIVVCNTHIAILRLFQRSETNLF